LYENTEEYLCADYEYEFLDINDKPVSNELRAKLSVVDGKIYFE